MRIQSKRPVNLSIEGRSLYNVTVYLCVVVVVQKVTVAAAAEVEVVVVEVVAAAVVEVAVK